MLDKSLALNIIECMLRKTYSKSRKPPIKSNAGRKPGPQGKLVPICTLFVSKARAAAMLATQRNTGQTPSQQAAAALDVADPLPKQETR